MIPASDNYPYSQLEFATWKALALFKTLKGFTYGWGFKIDLDLQEPNLIGRNPNTGEEGKQVDCSGTSRWIVWHSTGIDIGDGSADQHGEVKELNLKETTIDSVLAGVGHRYILFLEPIWLNGKLKRAGHVLIVVWVNGKPVTIESHGDGGCVSRPFDPSTYKFMGEMIPFVLNKEPEN